MQRSYNSQQSPASPVLLFGAGADMDALCGAFRGGQLLFETFRNLTAAKDDGDYRAAFQELFGDAPKLSYSWKTPVKEMIRRALRNHPTMLLSCAEANEVVDIGGMTIKI